MPEKPINPAALSALMIRKFVEMGMLEEKKMAGRAVYFLTDQGRMILANFGINEADLYSKK